MRRSGFTLIELMIAIAIVTMLTGIVLPIGLSRLRADARWQVQGQLQSAVSLARADAMRRGEVVKLVASEAAGEVTLWAVRGSGDDGATAREFVLDLPPGVGFEDAAIDDESSPGDAVELLRPVAGESPVAVERALCVLMPDGSVVPGDAAVLRIGEQFRFGLEFNPWTGSMSYVAVVEEEPDDARRPDVGEVDE